MFTYPFGFIARKFKPPMIITLDTSLGDALNQFKVPTVAGYSYNITWIADKGTANEKTGSYSGINPSPTIVFNGIAGIHTLELKGTQEAWSLNNGGDALKPTIINKFGDTGLIYLMGGFSGCLNLVNASDSDGDWMRDVTTTFRLFKNDTNLLAFDASSLNMSSNENAFEMFYNCTGLTVLDVSNFNTSKLIVLYRMFFNLINVTVLEVGGWDATTFVNLFQAFANVGVTRLRIDLWTIPNVEEMGQMLSGVVLDTDNFSDILISYAGQSPNIQNNVPFGASSCKYYVGAASNAYNFLTAPLGTPGTGIYTGKTSPEWNITTAGPEWDTTDLSINSNQDIIKSGNDYIADGATWLSFCLFNEFLDSGVDGAVLFEYNSIADGTIIIAFDVDNTNKPFSGYDSALYFAQSSGEIRALTNGVLGSIIPTTAVINSALRLRRVGADVLIEYASDKVNFVTLYTFVGVGSGAKYINLNLNINSAIRNLGGINLT